MATTNKDILVYVPDIPSNYSENVLAQMLQTRLENGQRVNAKDVKCFSNLGIAVIHLSNEADKTYLVSNVQSMVLDMKHGITVTFVNELDLDCYIALDQNMAKIPSPNELARRYAQTYKTQKLRTCEAISMQFPNIFHILLGNLDELVKAACTPDFKIEDSFATVYSRAECSFFEDLPSNTNDEKLSSAIATQIGEKDLPATSFYVQYNKQTGNAVVLAVKSAKRWVMESFLTIDGRNVSKKAKLAYRILVSPVPRGYDLNRILSSKLFAGQVIKHTHIDDHLIVELDDIDSYNSCLEFGALRIERNVMQVTPHVVGSNPDLCEIDAVNWYETEMLDMKPDIMTIINNPQHPILHYKWNSENWLLQFRKADTMDRRSKRYDLTRHLLRVTVMLNTIATLRKKKYEVDGEEVTLKSGHMQTIGYDHQSKLLHGKKVPLPEMKTPYTSTNVIVVNEDCLVLYEKLVSKGYKPVVLNMANATSPGGGYRKGDGAQEENLFRRSDYYQSLDLDAAGKDRSEQLYCTSDCKLKRPMGYGGLYPMSEFGAIYTSGITVFRQTEEKGYAYMKKPLYDVCAIAMAAHREPRLNDKNMLENKFAINTLKKIENTFAITHHHGHDCLVLSALGCGAFRNPPEHVALLFKSVIQQYAGYFETIYFAIIDDHNTGNQMNPRGNFIPFKEVLDGVVVRPPKIIRINGVSGPHRILDKSSDEHVTLSSVCISSLPPCHHGAKCHDIKNSQHNSTYSHPSMCLQHDASSSCDQVNDEVHMFTFIHNMKCKYAGECNSTDPKHLSEFDHPEFCKDEGRCENITQEHLSANRHLPVCRDGLDCPKYLKGDPDHCKSRRHCRSICVYDNCCADFHDRQHMRNTIHSFREPCAFTPYNCSIYVQFIQTKDKQKIRPEVEKHCLTHSHVCLYGRQCNFTDERHFETSIHVAREFCPDMDKCSKLTDEDHLESFSHPSIRDIRLFCRHPGFECQQRFDNQHLRTYRHGRNYNHVSVAPFGGVNQSIDFFSNQSHLIGTVNNYIEKSNWRKAKISHEILSWIQALQPVHRCGKDIFESVLVHGHVMSRDYMKLLKNPECVSKAVEHHSRVRLIFLRHNNPALREHACKLIEIQVQAEFAKAATGGSSPSDSELEYKINMTEKRLKPSLTDEEIKTICDSAIEIAQASIKLHSSPTGIGYKVDQILGTDKQVFSILGPHRGHYYGDIFIIFKREIMLHPDTNFSVQAATTFGPSLNAYKHRPWLTNPNDEEKRTEQFHKSKLHCSVPRYEYAAATELVALTGKDRKTMDVNLQDIIQRWMHVDSHEVFEAHLPQRIPLDYVDCVYIPKTIFKSLTPEAQKSAKAIFNDSLIITDHSIDPNIPVLGGGDPDGARKSYQKFVLQQICQKIEKKMNAPHISRGIVITVPGTKFGEHIVLPMTISQSYDLYRLNNTQKPQHPEVTYIYWQAMNGDMMLTISNEKIEPSKDQPDLQCLICYVAGKPSTAAEDHHEEYSYLNNGHPLQHDMNVHTFEFKTKSNVFYPGCNTDDFFTFRLKLSHKTGEVTLSHAGPNGIYNHEKIYYQFNKSDLDLSRMNYIHVSAGTQDVPIRNLTINHETLLELHPSSDKNFKMDTSGLLQRRRATVDHIVRAPYYVDAHNPNPVSEPYRQRSASVQSPGRAPPPTQPEKPSIFRRIIKAVFPGPSAKDNPPPYIPPETTPKRSDLPASRSPRSRSPPSKPPSSYSPVPKPARSRSPISKSPRSYSPASRSPRSCSPRSKPQRSHSPTTSPQTYSSSQSTSSKLPLCRDSVYCLNQKVKDHTEKYSHLCRFNELCRNQASESHLVHERHNVPKCSDDEDCTQKTDPVHRAKYRHTNLPDYLFPCQFQDTCYDKSTSHRTRFFHGEELPSIKKSKTSTTAHFGGVARAHLIPCWYGNQCRSMKDPQHTAKFSHPT